MRSYNSLISRVEQPGFSCITHALIHIGWNFSFFIQHYYCLIFTLWFNSTPKSSSAVLLRLSSCIYAVDTFFLVQHLCTFHHGINDEICSPPPYAQCFPHWCFQRSQCVFHYPRVNELITTRLRRDYLFLGPSVLIRNQIPLESEFFSQL